MAGAMAVARTKRAYDVVIVGAGGHGLATAYYLAAEHGIRNVAVLDKGWLGGGNTGRNTTIIRSNYLWDESAAIYEHSLKLWEDLSQALNYNVMYSPRGVMMLAHNHHDVQVFRRHVHANRLQGIDNEWLTPEQAKAFCPPWISAKRFAIRYLARRYNGAAGSRGTTRLPGVTRGRPSCARRGYHPELRGTGIDRDADGTVTGCEARAGRSGPGDWRGRRWPHQRADGDGRRAHAAGIVSACRHWSEPVKPVLPCVVMSNTVHAYISQSDKGELVIGAGTDAYTSYSQAGGLHIACADAGGDLRTVSVVPPAAHAAQLGWHRRYAHRTGRRSSG